jgi:hypothetical protein
VVKSVKERPKIAEVFFMLDKIYRIESRITSLAKLCESEYFGSCMDAPDLTYDLAVAWTWKFDREFIHLVERAALDASLNVLLIDPLSIAQVTEDVRNRSLYFKFFLDRASDEDEIFLPLARLIQKRGREQEQSSCIRPLNPLDLIVRASDKATMHLEFLSYGMNVPYTIIISPYNHKKEVELTLSELAKLGRPFIIKPANTTGGGLGVVTGAETLKDIIDARQHHRNDKYLLQETIKPVLIGNRRAWFRVFYAFGGIQLCWWDDQTHLYEILDPMDEALDGLRELRNLVRNVHDICKLDFFSTEFVLTIEKRVIAVDYVNEMCDMRVQSSYPDGVPDQVVKGIVELLVSFVKKN